MSMGTFWSRSALCMPTCNSIFSSSDSAHACAPRVARNSTACELMLHMHHGRISTTTAQRSRDTPAARRLGVSAAAPKPLKRASPGAQLSCVRFRSL